MSRLVTYRSKMPEIIKLRMEQVMGITMYLVQTVGPTSYVVQEQNNERKYKVLIGSLQQCSCGDPDVCIHILFVLLKVLRLPSSCPIVWQKSLVDSEIEALLRGDYREQTRAEPKEAKSFLKKKREAMKNRSINEEEGSETEVHRHEVAQGEVCAICQEDMDDPDTLTYCRKGCGNNFHIECMRVFGESRKQSKENIVCPLCRQDWGTTALTALKKESDHANKAPNVHRKVACRRCRTTPIRKERYRCLRCKKFDLCRRCFDTGAHAKHPFVVKLNVGDGWTPALRNQERNPQVDETAFAGLENRELTTNDYDLLLQLDQGQKYPLHEYLMAHLESEKLEPSAAKEIYQTTDTCELCHQSLTIQSAVHRIACGHSFHESCASRALLSQVYACPHKGCEQVLFPGLHYSATSGGSSVKAKLTSKAPKDKFESALPPIDPVLSISSVQHESSSIISTPRSSHTTPSRTQTREKKNVSPVNSLPELSVGNARATTVNAVGPRLPVMSKRTLRRPPRVSNQEDSHETTESKDAFFAPVDLEGRLNARMELAEQSRISRLEEKKNRMKKKNMLRVQRVQAANANQSIPFESYLSTQALPTINSNVKSKRNRQQDEIASRRRAREAQQQQNFSNLQQSQVPDLCIQNKLK